MQFYEIAGLTPSCVKSQPHGVACAKQALVHQMVEMCGTVTLLGSRRDSTSSNMG
jgi:hypothetical protein